MNKFPIALDGIPYAVILIAATFASVRLFLPLSIFLFLLLAFVLFFFRNPKRFSPEGDNLILSPADGKVLSITEVYEPDYLKANVIKVSIFLSLFDVHINRSPIEGEVEYVQYRSGKFLKAFLDEAAEVNERNTIGIRGKNIKVLVHQIAGLLARRIVCRANRGDLLNAGERFGLIKFGSCTEVLMPSNIEVKVKVGDRVKGAETIIGVMN